MSVGGILMRAEILGTTFKISAPGITVEVVNSGDARFEKYQIMEGNKVLVLDGKEIGAIFSGKTDGTEVLLGLWPRITGRINGVPANSTEWIPITKPGISHIIISRKDGTYCLKFQSN